MAQRGKGKMFDGWAHREEIGGWCSGSKDRVHFYLSTGLGRHVERSRDRVSMSSMSSLWLLHGRELQRAGREARRLAGKGGHSSCHIKGSSGDLETLELA